ncbi:MAG: AraC family transcriptional regulator [Oxalobacteraceae bacterium]|nr:MAG: AraC family transcriptional regulator [Oxalobacteraceae bacterium]
MDPLFLLHRGSKQRHSGLPTHTHDTAQLTFAASGIVQVHTAEGRWLVPPQLAVWIPAGVPHHVEVLADAELWMVHWQPAAVREWGPDLLPDRPFALRVTPLLGSLLTAAFATGIEPRKTELLVRLMLHELTETTHAPTFLPLPTTAAARRVAELAVADPRTGLDLGELASRAATSVRTVSRLFPLETGLTFKAWRQRARIVHAMDLLARGETIARVSAGCGFASTAAFSSAFRQVTGMTPTGFSMRANDGPLA